MPHLLDEDVLRRLVRPDGAAPLARPLGDVRRRAAILTGRRRRAAVAASLAATAGVALVVVAVVVPPAGPAPLPPRPGATTSGERTPGGGVPDAARPACTASDVTLRPADLPALLYVADVSASGPRRGPVLAGRTTRCPHGDRGTATDSVVTQYFGSTQVDGGGDWWLHVSDRTVVAPPAAARPPRVASRAVTLRPGVTATWQPFDNGSDARGSLTWQQDGLEFAVSGEVSLAKALAVARSLEKVAPDDPRLR